MAKKAKKTGVSTTRTVMPAQAGALEGSDIRLPYGMRRAELQAIAVKQGIENAGQMNKAQLEDALGLHPEPYDAGATK